MKKLIFIFTIISLSLASCNNNEVLLGSLKATVYLDSVSGKIINNARMSLATSQNNLNRGDLLLKDILSEADGTISVPDLNPGQYFYECIATKYGGGIYYGKGSFTIQEGKTTNIAVVLTEQ